SAGEGAVELRAPSLGGAEPERAGDVLVGVEGARAVGVGGEVRGGDRAGRLAPHARAAQGPRPLLGGTRIRAGRRRVRGPAGGEDGRGADEEGGASPHRGLRRLSPGPDARNARPSTRRRRTRLPGRSGPVPLTAAAEPV